MSTFVSQKAYVGFGLAGLALINLVVLMIRVMEADPIMIGFGRLSIATVGLCGFLKYRDRLQTVPRASWIPLIKIGVLFGLHWLTWFWCIKLSTAPIAMAAISSYGIFLTFFGWCFLSQKPTMRSVLAVAMVIIGNLMVVPEFSLHNEHTLGLMVGVLSALFFSLVPIVHQQHKIIPSDTRTLGQFTVAWVMFACMLPWSTWQVAPMDWVYLMVMGVFSTLIGHGLWVLASTHLPAAVISCLYFVGVPYIIVLGAVFLDETLPTIGLIGTALIVAANLMVLLQRKAEPPDYD